MVILNERERHAAERGLEACGSKAGRRGNEPDPFTGVRNTTPRRLQCWLVCHGHWCLRLCRDLVLKHMPQKRFPLQLTTAVVYAVSVANLSLVFLFPTQTHGSLHTTAQSLSVGIRYVVSMVSRCVGVVLPNACKSISFRTADVSFSSVWGFSHAWRFRPLSRRDQRWTDARGPSGRYTTNSEASLYNHPAACVTRKAGTAVGQLFSFSAVLLWKTKDPSAVGEPCHGNANASLTAEICDRIRGRSTSLHRADAATAVIPAILARRRTLDITPPTSNFRARLLDSRRNDGAENGGVATASPRAFRESFY